MCGRKGMEGVLRIDLALYRKLRRAALLIFISGVKKQTQRKQSLCEAARVQRFVDALVGHLYNAVAPQMKTLTYCDADHARKIENKGLEEHAAYDVHKKAKTGGSFGGNFSANHRPGKATTGFSDRDRFVFTVCIEAAS
ncbi:hypothetical protein H5410_060354 [Solanum commersonii]|uniref:Uncharacterized protein n=1 Tax=Solanum commersonii TaxID=4109 RepID=A0A9J5W5R8_SOLCO|nr:hypothetical protein H5410_060354 [Solanum commersonii]